MDSMSNPFVVWVDYVVTKIIDNKNKFFIGMILATLLVAGFFGYRWYNQRAQMEAHKDFMESLTLLDAPIQGASTRPTAAGIYFASDEEKWKKVEASFRSGQEAHKSSGLASMFGMFLAEALINQNKLEEAIDVMKSSVDKIENDEIREWYRVKYSLMQLDSTHEKNVTEALGRLQVMGFDQTNSAQGQALYYLGLYFWVNKKFDEAKNYWQQFLVKYGNENGFEEQIRLAKSRLELIAV